MFQSIRLRKSLSAILISCSILIAPLLTEKQGLAETARQKQTQWDAEEQETDTHGNLIERRLKVFSVDPDQVQETAAVAQTVVDLVDDPTPKAELKESLQNVFQKLKTSFQSEMGQRIRVALTITLFNSIGITWSLTTIQNVGLAPAELSGAALKVGVLMGLCSGAMRMFPKQIARFFDAKGKPFYERILRWFGVEFLFINISKVLGTAFGLSTMGSLSSLVHTAGAAALAVPVQGLMDLAISENYRLDLIETMGADYEQQLESPEAFQIQKKANRKFLASSVISTTLAIATAVKAGGTVSVLGLALPNAGIAMALVGLGGAAYYLKTHLRTKKCELAFQSPR